MDRHWLNRQRLAVYSLAFLCVYLFLGVYLTLKFRQGVDPLGNPIGCDFITFWAASRLDLAGNAVGAYDPQLLFEAEKAAIPGTGFNAVSPWQYPPMFLLLVLPLSLLPYFVALATFLASTFALYFVTVGKILSRRECVLPLLAFPAVFINVGGGQNGFLTAALASGVLLLLDRRPAWSGVLLGLLTIKPQLGLLFPLALLCGQRWRVLLFASLTAAAFLGLSLFVLGPDTLPAFIGRLPIVAQWLSDGSLPLKKMPTFFALVRLLGAPTTIAYAIHGVIAAAVAAAVAWVWLRCRDGSLRSASLLAGTVLISPYLYDYDLVCLAPAIAWFIDYALRHGWRRGEREVLVATWLLPGCVIIIHHLLHVQLAPFVLLAFFLIILRRAAELERPAMDGQVEAGVCAAAPPSIQSQ
jgi:alpha-1,2-mannosyltransferase